jgi:hypothetical protein
VILFCHWHKKEAEELMKTNSDVSVTVGGGSGVGITAMIDGTLISQWLQEI